MSKHEKLCGGLQSNCGEARLPATADSRRTPQNFEDLPVFRYHRPRESDFSRRAAAKPRGARVVIAAVHLNACDGTQFLTAAARRNTVSDSD